MENNEKIDFERDQAKVSEYAESVFTNNDYPQVEEGHEFDYMRLYDGHTVDDVVEIKE